MELKEAKNILEERKPLLINSSMPDISLITAIDTVLEELNNRISKEILEEYLTQAEERYKTYKEASKENEGCKSGIWKYLGEIDVLKRILGKSIKIVTLDKE